MAAVIMSDYRKLESLAKRPVMRRQKEIITESRRPVSYSGQPLADNNNMVGEAAKKMNLRLNFLADPPTRMKFGSNRKTGWLRRRRRSRSIDSSELLCDFSAREASIKLRQEKASKRLDTLKQREKDKEHWTVNPVKGSGNDCRPEPIGCDGCGSSRASKRYNSDDVYEEAVMVAAVRGASYRDNPKQSLADVTAQTPAVARRKRFSMQRKCMSMNDVDYENVKLVNPSTESSSIYEDPWNTEQTINKYLSNLHLDGKKIANLDTAYEADDPTHENQERRVELTTGVIKTMPANGATVSPADLPMFTVDKSLPLLQQCWYHDEMSRQEAESHLVGELAGAFLVRINSHRKKDLTLSVRTTMNVVHLVARRQEDCKYILGQFSEPFDSASAMIEFYSKHLLKIQNAPHTYLTKPIPCVDILLSPLTSNVAAHR